MKFEGGVSVDRGTVARSASAESRWVGRSVPDRQTSSGAIALVKPRDEAKVNSAAVFCLLHSTLPSIQAVPKTCMRSTKLVPKGLSDESSPVRSAGK
jgi:hypothetical protein